MDLYSSFIIYLILFRLSIVFAGLASTYFGYKLFLNGVFVSNGGKGKGTDFGASIGDNKFILKNAAPGTLFALFGIILISTMLIKGSPELVQESLTKMKPNLDQRNSKVNSMNDTIKEENINSSSIDSVGVSSGEKYSELSRQITDIKKDYTQLVSEQTKLRLRNSTDMNEINAVIDERIKARLYEGGAMSYLFDEKDYTKALNAIAININAVAWNNKLNGKPEIALEQAKIAVALSPENANFLDTLSEIYVDLTDYKNAVIYMKRAAEIDPNKRSRLEALESLIK